MSTFLLAALQLWDNAASTKAYISTSIYICKTSYSCCAISSLQHTLTIVTLDITVYLSGIYKSPTTLISLVPTHLAKTDILWQFTNLMSCVIAHETIYGKFASIVHASTHDILTRKFPYQIKNVTGDRFGAAELSKPICILLYINCTVTR